VASLPGLKFRGLLSHAGHAYHAGSEMELEHIATREAEILRALAEHATALGVTIEEISVGSTPTSRFIGKQVGAPFAPTEMRPGNYVFFDRTQTALEAATLDTCAMFIAATVVSRPAPDRIILDSGAK